MNPVLIDAIRRRLAEQSTDQLLALWTTNDRVMWSPEAFEAVKVELAARGVRELPPQNDPAPLAQPHSPALDPATQYWMGWVRPVLWICVVVGAAGLPYALVLIGSVGVVGWRGGVLAREWLDGWYGARLWIEQILRGALPLWLLVASVAGLRLKPWARTQLLTYAATAIVLSVIAGALTFIGPHFRGDRVMWLISIPTNLAQFARELVLPVILWTLLRRPEIRSLFVPAPTGRAFEPLPAAGVPQASTGA